MVDGARRPVAITFTQNETRPPFTYSARVGMERETGQLTPEQVIARHKQHELPNDVRFEQADGTRLVGVPDDILAALPAGETFFQACPRCGAPDRVDHTCALS